MTNDKSQMLKGIRHKVAKAQSLLYSVPLCLKNLISKNCFGICSTAHRDFNIWHLINIKIRENLW